MKFAMEGRKQEHIVAGKLKGRHYSSFTRTNDIKQMLHLFRKTDDGKTSKGYLKIKPSCSSVFIIRLCEFL